MKCDPKPAALKPVPSAAALTMLQAKPAAAKLRVQLSSDQPVSRTSGPNMATADEGIGVATAGGFPWPSLQAWRPDQPPRPDGPHQPREQIAQVSGAQLVSSIAALPDTEVGMERIRSHDFLPCPPRVRLSATPIAIFFRGTRCMETSLPVGAAASGIPAARPVWCPVAVALSVSGASLRREILRLCRERCRVLAHGRAQKRKSRRRRGGRRVGPKIHVGASRPLRAVGAGRTHRAA
jgi:hypothetical protein